MRKISVIWQCLVNQCSFIKKTTQYIHSIFWIDLIALILGGQMFYYRTEIPSLHGQTIGG